MFPCSHSTSEDPPRAEETDSKDQPRAEEIGDVRMTEEREKDCTTMSCIFLRLIQPIVMLWRAVVQCEQLHSVCLLYIPTFSIKSVRL